MSKKKGEDLGLLKQAAPQEIQRELPRDNQYNSFLEKAIGSGMDATSLEKLVDLVHREQDRNQARAFNDALNKFQDRCPVIIKTKPGPSVGKDGTQHLYYYTPLEEIIRKVRPVLIELGFSWTWNTKVENGLLTVTCTLKHVNGHKEDASFSTIVNEGTRAMSGPQKYGGTVTYAERYSLMQVLGIHAEDEDGQSHEAKPDHEAAKSITPDQESHIITLIRDSGRDEKKFLKWIGLNAIHEMNQAQYKKVVRKLVGESMEGARK